MLEFVINNSSDGNGNISETEIFQKQKHYTGGPDITCQKNSGSLEGSNKSKKPLFIRSKIMGIN
jgi:hypothetical protein